MRIPRTICLDRDFDCQPDSDGTKLTRGRIVKPDDLQELGLTEERPFGLENDAVIGEQGLIVSLGGPGVNELISRVVPRVVYGENVGA